MYSINHRLYYWHEFQVKSKSFFFFFLHVILPDIDHSVWPPCTIYSKDEAHQGKCNKIKIWLPDCFLCTSVCPRSSILLRGWESSGENPVYWLQQGGSSREPLQWGRSGHCGAAANTAHQCGKTQAFGIGKAKILFVNTICDSIYAFYIKTEVEACHYCNLATLLLFLWFNTLTFVIHKGRLVSVLLCYLKQTPLFHLNMIVLNPGI